MGSRRRSNARSIGESGFTRVSRMGGTGRSDPFANGQCMTAIAQSVRSNYQAPCPPRVESRHPSGDGADDNLLQRTRNKVKLAPWLIQTFRTAQDRELPSPRLLTPGKGREKFFPRKIRRNPLKSLDSDERIQGNPSFSNPTSGGFKTEHAAPKKTQ